MQRRPQLSVSALPSQLRRRSPECLQCHRCNLLQRKRRPPTRRQWRFNARFATLRMCHSCSEVVSVFQPYHDFVFVTSILGFCRVCIETGKARSHPSFVAALQTRPYPVPTFSPTIPTTTTFSVPLNPSGSSTSPSAGQTTILRSNQP